jgi:transcriptional regulator with XRE-family HTH domain
MEKSRYSNYQEKLQELLRKKRHEAGLSQRQLAKSLKKTQSFVSKYETGERMLDVYEFKQICEVLGMTLHTVLKNLENKK